MQTYTGFAFCSPICNLASKANVDTACQMPLASCSGFHPFTNFASRASVYTLSQIPLANSFPLSPFTIFASRASGYPLLQKPHFQIMPIYNSFIIFLIGFLPLVGEFLPQTPNKNRRENLKSSLRAAPQWLEIFVFTFIFNCIKIKMKIIIKSDVAL